MSFISQNVISILFLLSTSFEMWCKSHGGNFHVHKKDVFLYSHKYYLILAFLKKAVYHNLLYFSLLTACIFEMILLLV